MSKFFAYIKFAKKRVNVNIHFCWMFILALFGGVAVFAIPILQKQLVDSIHLQKIGFVELMQFFAVSLLLVTTGIVQALLLNR